MEDVEIDVASPTETRVRLREISGQEGELDFFELHPQLCRIWSEPLLGMARAGFVELGRCEGGRFAIVEANRVVGITGFYAVPEAPEILRLRWHGLIPEARGRGLSGAAMRAACEMGQTRFPSSKRVVESMPAGPPGALIAKHFEALGFAPRGRPQPGGADGFDWQEWSAELETFLKPDSVRAARAPGKFRA